MKAKMCPFPASDRPHPLQPPLTIHKFAPSLHFSVHTNQIHSAWKCRQDVPPKRWSIKLVSHGVKTEQNRTEQSRTQQKRAEQNRTEQSRAEQSRVDQEQCRTEQNISILLP